MNFLKKLALSMIPKCYYGDLFYYFITFLVRHKRLPRTRIGDINDLIFFYKIKLYHNSLITALTDKEGLKYYIDKTFGPNLTPSTIYLIERKEDIDLIKIPKNSCVKPTHLTGAVEFGGSITENSTSNIDSWFGKNNYNLTREPNYRNIKPRVIVEELVFGTSNPFDYKFFVLKGEILFIQVDIGRFEQHVRQYLNSSWEVLNFSINKPIYSGEVPEPKNFFEMKNFVKSVSEKFYFVRVDLYTDGKRFKLGELTFFPENGGGTIIGDKHIFAQIDFSDMGTFDSDDI